MAEEDVDYEELIDGFDLDEAVICCSDLGVELKGEEYDIEVVKCVLRNRYCPTDASPEEVFGKVDDGDGAFTIREAQRGVALLGGILIPGAEMEAVFAQMDTDGDGGISPVEFAEWWSRRQAEEDAALERQWAATELQRVERARQVRKAVKTEHGFSVTVDLTLQEPDIAEGATALMFDLENGDGPSDWVTLDEAMEFIMEGSLTDDTIVWTEGMDDWMPLRKCRSVFNFGEDSESEEEVDYMEMINEFDEDDTIACLRDCGIEVDGKFPLETLKSALRSRYGAKERTVQEVFDLLDADSSGSLDLQEAQMASAILGGVLLSTDALKGKFAKIDTDGDGTISFAEFEKWWGERSAEEEQELEQTWAAMELQRVCRGRQTRLAVEKEHGYSLAKARARRATAAPEPEAEPEPATQDEQAPEKAQDTEAAQAEAKRKEADAKEASERAAALKKEMEEKEQKQADAQKFANERLLADAKRKAGSPHPAGDTIFDGGDGIASLTHAEALEACKMAGVNVRPGASVEDMHIALNAKFEAENLSVREVFDKIDEDGGGTIDRNELKKGAAMLGLVVGEDDVNAVFDKLVGDGDQSGEEGISFQKFMRWWYNEKDRKPSVFWSVRSFSYKESGKKIEDLCVSEIQELIANGVITDDTEILTDEFDSFKTLGSARTIVELNQALNAKYNSSMIFLEQDGTESDEMSPAEMRDFIRNGVISEDTKVKTGPGAADSEAMHGLGGTIVEWTPLSDVKHVFGLAEYMPLADDTGGIVSDGAGSQGPDIAKLAKSMEEDFNKQAWGKGLEEGLNKLRGMSATSKKSAKRMKRRAKKLAKSKAAEEAKQKAAALTASKKAGDTLRADELQNAGMDIAASLVSGLQSEGGDDGSLASDAGAVMNGLKETLGEDFATRRRMLSEQMGGGGGGGRSDAMKKIEGRAMAQKDEAMKMFAGVKSPADAMQVIRENPAFVKTLEGVVIDSVEDLIKGINIPAIAGETPDQRYRIWNMKIKGFGQKPQLKVSVKKGVRIEVRNIDLQFDNFDFFLDRHKFPKVKDTGVGKVSCKCWCYLAFEIKLDEQKNMTVDKFRAQVTIDELPMDIVKCNHKKVFKTLLKMFQKKGKEGVQEEIHKKTQENIKMLSDKVTALFEQFGGKSKLDELKKSTLEGDDTDGDTDDDAVSGDDGTGSDYSSSETGSDIDELEDGEYHRLVVDVGYGGTKYGLAGRSKPKFLRNTRDDEDGQYQHAITRNKLDYMKTDWALMEDLWEWMFEDDLGIEADDCCVLSTVSPYGPKQYAERLAELMFETHDVPGIYLGVPAIFCLYAQGKTNGVVLDSGECVTSAIPVFDGYAIASAAQQLPFGGRDITSYIERYLIEHNEEELAVKSLADFNVVDRIKRECCYCGTGEAPEHEDSYEMPDGTEVTIEASADADDDDAFPFNAPHKFFFDPLKLDWSDTSMEFSVHDRLHEAVMQSPIDGRRAMWGNCVIAGGNTMYKGFAETLYKKLKPLPGCRGVNLKIVANGNRDIMAWQGASVIASMDSFMSTLISQEVYDEEGPEVVHKLNIFALS